MNFSSRRRMLVKRCLDLKHCEYVFLTYFRSGTTMTKHIINKAGGEVIHFHQLPMDIREKYLKDKKLILLIRDYKECIVSNCWTRHRGENMTNRDIDDLFTDKYVEEYRAGVYIEHLKHFETWPNEKILIRYEDIIQNPSLEYFFLLHWMGLDCRFDCREELKRVKYEHEILSGEHIRYHYNWIDDRVYFTNIMCKKAESAWQYIKHYEL